MLVPRYLPGELGAAVQTGRDVGWDHRWGTLLEVASGAIVSRPRSV